MFINTDNKDHKKDETSSVLSSRQISTWALVLKLRPVLITHTPGNLGCMRQADIDRLTTFLGKSSVMVRAQFTSVSETKKPEVLKKGKEDEIRKLAELIQHTVCECIFSFEVKQVV
jgi:hypothetical protein